MTEVLVVLVAAFVVIAGATVLGPRLRIASPLVLVAIGVGASLLPMFTDVTIKPEWILEGVLPPLLYSAAVSMPSMNFRREFTAISGLSVLLVVVSALVLGLFFSLVVPGLGFAWGVALGAIISPTDAVATSIIKQTPVSKRVVAILDGESLLNDASALVLLRAASTAAIAVAAFSSWRSVGTFAWSVVAAGAIGWGIGWLNLQVRKRVTNPTSNTVISFAVPFAAAVPAELVGASGLVAAVVAGLFTGILAPRVLSPIARLSDSQNWRTVELVLEGAVFLTMGIQIRSIVTDVHADHAGVAPAVLLAVAAFVLVLLVRAAYVAPLLRVLRVFARHGLNLHERLVGMQEQLATTEGGQQAFHEVNPRRRRAASEHELDRFSTRLRRVLADIEYFKRDPLGWREGVIVVWAGMRGAVTVAAAQTLPAETPQRSALVVIAFAVAAVSLLVQGGTIAPVVRRLARPPSEAAAAEQHEDRERIRALLREATESIPEPPEIGEDMTAETYEKAKRYRLAVIAAQRASLLDARDDGTFDADFLAAALANLDATQIATEMHSRLA